MLRVSWLNDLSGRLLSSCRVKWGGRRSLSSRPLSKARRQKSESVPIEVLEFRTLFSVTSADPGPAPSVPAVAGNDVPLAHDDGPYYAVHD